MTRAKQNFVVAVSESGQRVDRVITARFAGVGRKQVRVWAAAGQLYVQGRKAPASRVVCAGDEVEIVATVSCRDFAPLANAALPLHVVHLEAGLLVVDKPAGMPCHPLDASDNDTLANALAARFPECIAAGHSLREAGLVHRLDNDTSGLVLVARCRQEHVALSELLRTDGVDKRYLAMCRGQIVPQCIDFALEPTGVRGHKMRVAKSTAARVDRRSQVTEILTSQAWVDVHGECWSLLHIRLHRGSRHQIRAHLAARGHPLAGDALYGGPRLAELKRQFLHANRIMIAPAARQGIALDVSAELPEDLRTALQHLGQA